MRKTTMVRYTVRPGQGERNQQLIEAIFNELQRTRPAGLSYEAFRLDDGLSFVHLARHESEGQSPLLALEAFQAFTAGLRERCEEPQTRTAAQRIGSYQA